MNGIERYFQINPSGPEFKQTFERQKYYFGRTGVSPVEIIAREIIKSCRRDAAEVEARRSTADGSLVFTTRQQDESNLSQKLMMDQVGMLFGVSLLVLDSALISREFDQEKFSDEYLEAIRGTLLHSTGVVDPQVERIPETQWQQMLGIVKEDKSLSDFFLPKGYRFMSGILKDPLEVVVGRVKAGSAVVMPLTPLRIIQGSILPGYVERYSHL